MWTKPKQWIQPMNKFHWCLLGAAVLKLGIVTPRGLWAALGTSCVEGGAGWCRCELIDKAGTITPSDNGFLFVWFRLRWSSVITLNFQLFIQSGGRTSEMHLALKESICLLNTSSMSFTRALTNYFGCTGSKDFKQEILST